MTSTSLQSDVEEALRSLPPAAKVPLLSGSGLWFTQEEPALGLPRIAVSDGPVGVRGHSDSEADGSVNLPSATCLAASWDRRLMARVGQVLAAEARRKNVDVVLGPTINLHRSPLAGRNFECFSEDPLLTGELATAYVTGIQDAGVGACPKHFVANEAESERTSVNNLVDERTLREVYLAPFERVISRARPWMIMAAYNGVNGKPMTESPLTETPLKTEWGFDGVVVSDWHAVYSTVESALSATDLAMPGPEKKWGADLLDAVEAGQIPEAVIDEKLRRLARLGRRVETGRRGKHDGSAPAGPAPASPALDAPVVAREAATSGFVLLENRGQTLPLHRGSVASVALIGPAALDPRTQGGGSASVFPTYTVGPAEGLVAKGLVATGPGAVGPGAEGPRAGTADGVDAGNGLRITTVQGAWLSDGLREPRPSECRAPEGDGQPVRLTWLGPEGTVAVEYGPRNTLTRGPRAIPAGATAVDIETDFTPDVSGPWQLGFKGIGVGELSVDGVPLVGADTRSRYADIGEVLIGAPDESGTVELTTGKTVRLRLRYSWHPEAFLFRVGLAVGEPRESPEDEIARAVAAAQAADVAVVLVGTSGAVESEGFDRTSLALPGRQDELVRAVIKANPRTVVVVNAGAPVEMPWRHEAAAVLLVWFPGMEFGNALADVLFGAAEPGGHLPTTWPATLADAPVSSTTPDNGVLDYSEGLHVGHRGWAKHGAAPAYWLGHGLGYTTFQVQGFCPVGAWRQGEDLQALMTVRNTGSRPGKYLAQVYADAPDSAVDRPALWLAGFETAAIPAGETRDIPVVLPWRTFQRWDAERGWVDDATRFRIAPAADAGAARTALTGPLALTLQPSGTAHSNFSRKSPSTGTRNP